MDVSLVLIVVMAVLFACGVYAMLERSLTRVLIGFLLLGNATNLLLLIVMGQPGVAPFFGAAASTDEMSDPLPQALTLTAIVITFAISAFLLALIYRSWQLGQADTVEDDDADIAVRERGADAEDAMDDETEIETTTTRPPTSSGSTPRRSRCSAAATSPASAMTPRPTDPRDAPKSPRAASARRRVVTTDAPPSSRCWSRCRCSAPRSRSSPAGTAARRSSSRSSRSPSCCVIAAILLVVVDVGDAPIAVSVGGWPIPFGIVLYVDRLAALLVVVSSIVLLAVLLFSVGQGAADGDDDTPVSIFHPSYLILAAGIFTAFIAGDLFNLYVGLRDPARRLVRADHARQHRVAHPHRRRLHRRLARLVDPVPRRDRGDLRRARHREHGADLRADDASCRRRRRLVLHLLLLLAFSIKAAVFPLSFWLPDSYPTAPAPVTAVFAGLLTKVGVYAMIRTETAAVPRQRRQLAAA